MIATSGLCARTLRRRSSASPAWATTSNPASSSSRAAPSRSSDRIVRDHDSHGISTCTTVPPPGGLITFEAPVERSDAIGQPTQARAGRRVGSSPAVVANLDVQPAVHARGLDLDARPPRRSGSRW